MYIMIICHGLQIYCITLSFKTIAGRSDGVFWWFPALFEDQEKTCWIHQNYLVALTEWYDADVVDAFRYSWEVPHVCKVNHSVMIIYHYRCIWPGLFQTVRRDVHHRGSETTTVTKPATTQSVSGMVVIVKVCKLGCIYKILRTENHGFETQFYRRAFIRVFSRACFWLSRTVLLLRISFCAACPLAKGQTGHTLFDLDHCDVI